MKTGTILNLVLVLVVFVLMVGQAEALVMAFDFEGNSDWAVNLTGEGSNISLQRQGDAVKVASGAGVPVAGSAARFYATAGYNTFRMPFQSNNYYSDYSGTIAAWVRLGDGDKALPSTITWDSFLGWVSKRTFRVSSGLLQFYDGTDTGGTWHTSTVPVFGDGETGWHHVAVTFEAGGDVVFYKDGVQLGDAMPAVLKQSLGVFDRLSVGHDPVGAAWMGVPFQGDIDEVYMNYGEAKDAAFINAIMNGGVMVPEPVSMVLLGLGSVVMIRKRK